MPRPAARRGGVIVGTEVSLISAGTERASIELSQKSLVAKARARPDLVRQVVRTAQREGIVSAYRKVTTRLDAWEPLGYSSCGIVLEAGERATDLPVGARVACAGAGYASHAELIYVPRNLCVTVPDGVPASSAAYTTVASIALHAVRLAEAAVGGVVAVQGLGLVGQLAVQILLAAGCHTIGIDPDEGRRELARSAGATVAPPSEAEAVLRSAARGRGADAVLITAASPSNGPIEQAAELARDRGIVVVVGNVGLDVPREPFYRKELRLRVSRSYGPGRYDPEYEEHGLDYPVGYVRWTERRNMEAVLDLMARGTLRPGLLTSHSFDFADVQRAYDLITAQTEPHLGVLVTYPAAPSLSRRIDLKSAPARRQDGEPVRVGLVGAGNFARDVILPALKAAGGVRLLGIASGSGVAARTVAESYGFAFVGEATEVIDDPECDAIVIATRHDSHASLAAAALRRGKAVYVEKPLGLTEDEILAVLQAAGETGGRLLVGFNRRFAPLACQMRELFSTRSKGMLLQCRVNAGPVAPSHWSRDAQVGGGRILGEVCHFVDLLGFLAGSPIGAVRACVPSSGGDGTQDDVAALLEFANGALGSILYTGRGDATFSKERVELFGGGAVAVLDDFRRLELVVDGRRTIRSGGPDKGHEGEIAAFLQAVRKHTPMPVALDSLANSSLATVKLAESIRTGRTERVPDVVWATA